MSVLWKKDIKRLRAEHQTEFGTVYTRVWAAPDQTLSTLGLNKGATLPSETGIAYAEIIDVRAAPNPQSPGKLVVTVQAFLADLFAGVSRTDTTRELAKTRLYNNSHGRVQIVRNFEITDSDLSETGGSFGWTATNLPVRDDTYPTGTWTITPTVSEVQIDPEYTAAKSRAAVVYIGYLAWDD